MAPNRAIRTEDRIPLFPALATQATGPGEGPELAHGCAPTGERLPKMDPEDQQGAQEIAAGMQEGAQVAANFGDLQTAQDYAWGAQQIQDGNMSPDEAQQVMVDVNQGGGPDQAAWDQAYDTGAGVADDSGDQ